MELAGTAKVKRGSESLSEASSEWLPFNMAGNKIVKYSLIHIKIFIECLLCASIMNGGCLFQQGIQFPFPKSSYFLSNYLIPIPQFLGTSSGAPAFMTRDGHGYNNWIFLSRILPSQRQRTADVHQICSSYKTVLSTSVSSFSRTALDHSYFQIWLSILPIDSVNDIPSVNSL